MKEGGHKHIHMIKQLKVDAREDEDERVPGIFIEDDTYD